MLYEQTVLRGSIIAALRGHYGGYQCCSEIATQELAVFNFIALRFLLAFLVSFIIFRKRCGGVFSKDARKHVLIVGVVTYLAHVTCTGGISMTPVSVAGFLTSLQTIAIPIIAFLFMHRRFERKTLLCITGAFISICLITIGNHMEYGTGMWICLASSALAGLPDPARRKISCNGG